MGAGHLDKIKLGVKRQGAKWQVSVNDSPVISVSDTAEPLTGLGLMVLGENTHAAFDNLKVYTEILPRAPPSAPSGFVAFSDTFVDGWNRGWYLNDNIHFQGGALNLAGTSDRFTASKNERIPKVSSFAYQAELYFKEALPQTHGGLEIGKEQGTIYFMIWPTTRQFEIYYYSPGEGFDSLIRKTFSGAIKGTEEVNKLLVIGRDFSLEFYVNDVFLRSYADPYPDSPLTVIRLAVKGEDSQGAFDNVALYSLSPLPVATQVTYPTAISGDPSFSSSFSKPTQARIGPFTTQTGDYFVSYTMTAAELSAYQADHRAAPIRKKLLEAVRDNFKDSIDFVIVVLDADQPASGIYGSNYTVQPGSVHNPDTPRFARLGNLWLTTRRGLSKGPALHELLHGFHKSMMPNSTSKFIILTTIANHWGFSSAGGQLGGWEKSTLVSLGDGTYQAKAPQLPPGYTEKTGFGLIANWGNSVPYSNLELWVMGLIPDSELVSVDVAEDASFIAEGKFKASAIRTYSPSEIIARTISGNRPSMSTPRAFRGLVVLATTRTSIDMATITQLNTDIVFR